MYRGGMAPVTLAKRATLRAVGTGVRAASAVTPFRPQGKQSYQDTLRTLSEASVEQCFNAFKDIAWDSPEFALSDDDDRWLLPRVDPLGATAWYQELPRARQLEVGRHRLVAMTKTGSQFEQLLLIGGAQFLMGLKNENPEFRYFMHELTEECHHIQMFQELTNRACPDVVGAPLWLRRSIPLVGLLGGLWPSLFFTIILAGEEPIDHLQKKMMRAGGQLHPMLTRITQIHIAEEARHIGFAHAWLEHHAPAMNAVNKLALGLMVPMVLRLGYGAIVVPSREDQAAMGIPDRVMREAFGGAENAKTRRDVCADVRHMGETTGILTPLTRIAWRLWGVDGRASRYRSEPASAAA